MTCQTVGDLLGAIERIAPLISEHAASAEADRHREQQPERHEDRQEREQHERMAPAMARAAVVGDRADQRIAGGIEHQRQHGHEPGLRAGKPAKRAEVEEGQRQHRVGGVLDQRARAIEGEIAERELRLRRECRSPEAAPSRHRGTAVAAVRKRNIGPAWVVVGT